MVLSVLSKRNEPMMSYALMRFARCVVPIVNFGEYSGGFSTASGWNPLQIIKFWRLPSLWR